ncbi:MAG: CinA family protein [Victivallales bacterium]|nr:CinA family protein [Victivallales bacterium]
MNPPELTANIQHIADELLRRGWWMATAESCTGGGIASALTAVPGSSQWFAGGLVTYIIPWKERLLGVPVATIEEFGVVSEETVQAMLQGLQVKQGVQAGIAVSGIAGPTGAEPGKPVGTVVVGVCAGSTFVVETCHFSGDREMVRSSAVVHGIKMLEQVLLKKLEKG